MSRDVDQKHLLFIINQKTCNDLRDQSERNNL